MKTTIKVNNLRNCNCSSSIARTLGRLTGVFAVQINIIDGIVDVDHTDEVNRGMLSLALLEMGYPEVEVIDETDNMPSNFF